MHYLNPKSTQIFKDVIEYLKGKDHVKIQNNKSYLPLTVEKLYQTPIGSVYSLCHYSGPINGDLMKDPDMTFVVTQDGIAPLEYQNDYAGIYTEAATIESGRLIVQSAAEYNSLVSFANTWMVNISEQQRLHL